MESTTLGRRLSAVLVLVLVVGASYLIVIPPAAAAGAISASPPSGLPGASFTISGAGFEAGETVSLCFGPQGCSNLGRPVTDAAGSFNRTVAVPAEASPGSVTLTACDSAGCAQTVFTVLAAPATTSPTTLAVTTTTTLLPTTTAPSTSSSTTVVDTPTTAPAPTPTSPSPTSPPRSTTTTTTTIGAGVVTSTTSTLPVTSSTLAAGLDATTTTIDSSGGLPSTTEPSGQAPVSGELAFTESSGAGLAGSEDIVDEVLSGSFFDTKDRSEGAPEELDGRAPLLGAGEQLSGLDPVVALDSDLLVAPPRPIRYHLDWVRSGGLWLITMVIAGAFIFGFDAWRGSRKS